MGSEARLVEPTASAGSSTFDARPSVRLFGHERTNHHVLALADLIIGSVQIRIGPDRLGVEPRG